MSRAFDFFGKDASVLFEKKLFCLDMDGTVYNENTIFPGTLDFLSAIEKNGGKYVFVTNNSSKSVKDYIAKVNAMGVKAGEENFFTSVQASAMLIKKNHPGQKIYCQGTASMLAELSAMGISVTDRPDRDVGAILVGFDTEVTGEKLRNTCIMLLRDVPYYATNPDLVCPVSFGYVPDCGSMCIALENATGRKPHYIGKPRPDMINYAMEKFSRTKEQTLVVGDRLYIDIASGLNAGVDTVCVLSGEADLRRIEATAFRPDYVFESVKNLADILG